MKKIIGFLMFTALMWALASCADEMSENLPANAEGLSFRITTPTEPLVLTRAIASNNEWNITTLDVYTAESGTVKKLTPEDFSISPPLGANPGQTYTVTMKNKWLSANSGKTVNFYFVGNDASSTNGAHASLSLVQSTGETAFKNSLTTALATQGPDTLNMILKPNGTDTNLLFSSDVQGVTVSGKVQETSQLKRREARFDIENKNAGTGANQFVVTGIEVINAADAGLIFGVGDAATPGINRTHNHFVPGLTGANPASAAANYTQYAPGSDSAAFDLAPSVFYLHPTTLVSPSPGATQTQIVVTGTYRGETKKLPVEVATETPINANYRYILSINPVLTKTELRGEEYEEGGTFESAPGENSALARLTPLTDQITGTGTYTTRDANLFSSSDLTLTTLPIKAESDFGTTWTLTPASAASEVMVEKIVTRAFIGTEELYRVTLIPGTTYLDAVLTISSGKVGSESFMIRRLSGGDASGILYFAANGTLKADSWANIQTEMGENAYAALAYFKFGSVIGFNNNWGESGVWNSDMSAIKFNPSALTAGVGRQITAYSFDEPYDPTQANTLPRIPGFVPADWEAGIRDVSSPEYATQANVRAGRGDPCKLVGYTGSTLRSMSNANLQKAIDNAQWRLPTVFENVAFMGGPDLPFDETEMPATGFWKSWVPWNDYMTIVYTADPGVYFNADNTVNKDHPYTPYIPKSADADGMDEAGFPVVANHNAANSQILPAAGYRFWTLGTREGSGRYASWWSSTPHSDSFGHNLRFSSEWASSVDNGAFSFGFSVRCVPTEYAVRKVYAPDVLYFNGNRLAIGKWGYDVSDVKQLAFFKFGSVIGFDNVGTWNANMSAIKFNPTKLTVGASNADITAYAPDSYSENTSNALPYIPGYVNADWGRGLRNVSLSDYHNFNKIKEGKGDPCQLIGLTDIQIKNAANAEALTALLEARPEAQKGWRLPTAKENVDFVGGPSAATWNTSDFNYSNLTYNYFIDNSRNAGSPTNEGAFPVTIDGLIPAKSHRLPVTGFRDKVGSNPYPTNTPHGYYWSSVPQSRFGAHALYFNASVVHPAYRTDFSYGMPVRCVRQ